MSRTVQRNGGAMSRSVGIDDGEQLHQHLNTLYLHTPEKRVPRADAGEDVCPVCKSSRYLNPNMRFLVNPECYHKMCESCVDRIFSHGPAPCPIAGCGRTLRRHRFRAQQFEDIQVEREVDIRKRVAQIFNRRQEEFETLLDYNNYLEEVETVTFNLLYNIDVKETEAKLAAYAAQNAETISKNASLLSEEKTSTAALAAAEREQQRLRREAARREEEEERKIREEGRRDVLDRLATGKGDAEKITREAQKVTLKKTSAAAKKVADAARARQAQDPFAANGSAGGFTIKGLKKATVPEPEKPYDPFGGWTDTREYFVLQDSYEHPWLDDARTNPQITAGGYDVREYYVRTLFEAFSGLGCFISEEVAGRELASSKSLAMVSAAAAADIDLPMGDVF